MGIYIPTMADHWLKLLVCTLMLLTFKVNSHDNAMVNLTLIANAVEKGAVCLDGSPAGYHYAQGFGEGADNWLVYLPGGGWCWTKNSCLDRIKQHPDISTTINITNQYFGGILSPNKDVNPDFYNWNKVYIRYCDASSFMSDVEAVDPESNLHLRGARIFRAAIDELLPKGLKDAKKAILAGNSAGGLATILNCDRFRELVPHATTLKCLSDAGFFIHAENLPYVAFREHMFSATIEFHELANCLPESCTSTRNASLCFFPEYLVGDVQTPLFLLNSDFDQYQISVGLRPQPADEPGWKECTSQISTCTNSQLGVMNEFRNTFLETVKGLPNNPSRGLFINSCYIHDYLYSNARWNTEHSPRLEHKTIAEAVGDWYFDRCSTQLIDMQTDYPVDCKIG